MGWRDEANAAALKRRAEKSAIEFKNKIAFQECIEESSSLGHYTILLDRRYYVKYALDDSRFFMLPAWRTDDQSAMEKMCYSGNTIEKASTIHLALIGFSWGAAVNTHATITKMFQRQFIDKAHNNIIKFTKKQNNVTLTILEDFEILDKIPCEVVE